MDKHPDFVRERKSFQKKKSLPYIINRGDGLNKSRVGIDKLLAYSYFDGGSQNKL